MARFLKDKKKSKGAAPGSLIFIGRQKMPQPHIEVMQYNAEYLKEGEISSHAKIKDYIADQHVTWISVFGIHDTKLIEKIGHDFSISTLILEDILNTDERPKMVEDQEHLYFILKSLAFSNDSKSTQIEQVSFVVGKNYVITFHETQHSRFDDIIDRLSSKIGKIRSLSPDYLCYALMDSLVDNYILSIENLGNSIEEQEKILLSPNQEIITNIYRYKTELSFIRKNIRPVKEVISRFISSDSDLINSRTFNFLRDLEGLVTQALESIEIYYTMISDQQNTHNSSLSNNANDVMKVLTIFSATFIPLTFIAGVYGMNFNNMPELEHPYAYFILWGVMLSIAAVMIFFFKKKKWL